MSIGPLSIVGSLAATSLAQNGPEADKVQRQVADHSRQVESEQRAEIAAGIGQTKEESEASERDADGRQPWQRPGHEAHSQSAEAAATCVVADIAAKDPTGERGGLIDLCG